MRFRCEDCNSVKSAKLIHATKSFKKTRSADGAYGEINTFILQYRVGKHHHGTKQCNGSDKIQSKEYDGMIDLTF